MMIRLDKYLADMGAGTRSEIKKSIRAGRAAVNGAVTKRPETRIDTAKDTVELNGQNVSYEAYEYFMLNKPSGTVSAVTDRRETTVVSLIRDRKRDDLFPVGRLDKDTEGLLLITNDGALAHRLLAPAKHVRKIRSASPGDWTSVMRSPLCRRILRSAHPEKYQRSPSRSGKADSIR